MTKILIIFSIFLFTSCIGNSSNDYVLYGVNEKTTIIADIYSDGVSEELKIIMNDKSLSEIWNDSLSLIAIEEMKNNPITTVDLYYFENPNEIIGADYYSVRYVYNPSISSSVLDGMSPELLNHEKIRIVLRMQQLIMEYQKEPNKTESKKIIESGKPYGW